MKLLLLILLPLINPIVGYGKAEKWKIVNLTDKFGDKTKKVRLASHSQGSFSNSATTGSKLKVITMLDSDGTVGFMLIEYGWSKMTACCDSYGNTYYVSAKTARGVKKDFRATVYTHDWFVGINQKKQFIQFLKRAPGETVKVHISNGRGSTYLFPIRVRGFTRAYNIFKKRGG